MNRVIIKVYTVMVAPMSFYFIHHFLVYMVFDFSLGNPNLDPPDRFIESLKELITLPSSHGYMPNAGFPEVRSQIAGYVAQEQGIEVTGDQIIMTCGAGGALNVAFKSIINPGDVVLAATPCFMEYSFYVDNHGGTLDLVKSKADFDLDVDAARVVQYPAGQPQSLCQVVDKGPKANALYHAAHGDLVQRPLRRAQDRPRLGGLDRDR